jgi:hypothetical protein
MAGTTCKCSGVISVFCIIALLLAVLASRAGAAAAPNSTPLQIALGQSVAALNGPWRFHVGDDVRWADPAFNDSAWEIVDLTPRPGAHDGDVGLTGYAPGWNARGHRGYSGYAWYRLRISVVAPTGTALALSGPPLVDSGYQFFFDGRALGGSADFTGAAPRTFGDQPRMFPLAAGARDGVVAIRVWAGPGRVAGAPDAGGIHIAPAVGEASAIHDRYLLQWRQTFLGYIVDLVPAILLALTAVMAASLAVADPREPAYRWMCVGLLALAAARGNQVIMFWTQVEDGQTYNLVRRIVLEPLALGVWAMAWLRWFRIGRWRVLAVAVGALTAAYVASRLISGAWRPTAPIDRNAALFRAFSMDCRLGFAVLFIALAVLGLSDRRHRSWLALAGMAAVAAAVFGPELASLHVKGIWFPFGVGVSLSEYACTALVPISCALFLGRLLHLLTSLRAGIIRPDPPT